MKLSFILLSTVVGFGICGCHTVHKVENGTVKVADKTGHAVGSANQKVGDSISHGGQKLQEKTDNNQ
jgi:hypothetical protein